MKRLYPAVALSALLVATLSCTGGSETNAAVANEPPREAPTGAPKVDAVRKLADVSPAIPVYQGADFRQDLTSRDSVMVRSRYGTGAEVYTLATDDSFPQVYHYYTTYLAQFRAFPAQDTWPAEQKDWRTLEVPLTQAMQDPFIPGQALDPHGPQVLLQIAETEAEPRTVIRYIVMPPAVAPATAAAAIETAGPEAAVKTASSDAAAQPVAR